MLDILSCINILTIIYLLHTICLKLVVPFIEKLLYILKMAGNENKGNYGYGSDKTPGQNPQEPKNPSGSEYYINKKHKRVKRYYTKKSDEEKKVETVKEG